MEARERVFLGLGANRGDVLVTLAAAVFSLDELDGFSVEDTSGVYRTPPWPPPDDPRAVSQDDYLNLVVRGSTTIGPHDLLARTQQIETALGRDRSREQRWGPRDLDIDLLLYGAREVDTPELTVPHPRIAERAFVVVPLLEVFPGGALPDGRRLTALAMALGDIDDVELELRLDELPSTRIRRPDGPVGGPATFTRPGAEDVAREHGAGP